MPESINGDVYINTFSSVSEKFGMHLHEIIYTIIFYLYPTVVFLCNISQAVIVSGDDVRVWGQH